MKRLRGLCLRRVLKPLASWPHGRHRVLASATALGLALAATHRVVDRVHRPCRARCGRMPSQRRATGLAARDVHVVGVADLADRRVAVLVDLADFAGGQLDLRVTGFAVVRASTC